MARFVTRVQIENAPYPTLTVVWTHNEDQTLWTGECTIWKDGNTKGCDQHTISISQGIPLGHLSVDLDSVIGGAGASGYFPGYTITERDLFWASLWAVQCIRRKHELFGEEHCDHKNWRQRQREREEAEETLFQEKKDG